MKGFMETAHRLLEAGHPDSASIQVEFRIDKFIIQSQADC